MIKFTYFYKMVEEGSWKVMSQHIFPSLTVAMLTLLTLGFSEAQLNAQNGYCDNPFQDLEVSVNPDVSVCLGSSVELNAEAMGGILSLPRAYSIRVQPGNNLFRKENLDETDSEVIDMGTTIDYSAGDFANGQLYVLDLDNNQLVIIDTTTANRTVVGPMTPAEGSQVWAGLAYDDAGGNLYALSTDSTCSDSSIIYEVSIATGAATELYRLGVDCALWLGISPMGGGYVMNAIDSSLYSFDLSNGEMSLVGNIGTQVNFCQGADFDPLTGTLYAAIYDGFPTNETTFAIIDTETAELTELYTKFGQYCVVALANFGDLEYDYSWSPAATLSDPNISNPIADPTESTTYVVTVTDACGNTATGAVEVTVETPFPIDTTISCNSNVQVSVDGSCEAVITADMMLAGDYPCVEEFHIVDVDNRGTDQVDGDDIGEVLSVKVTRTDAQGNPSGNSCWGTIIVEDKLRPIIECSNDTLYCWEGINPAFPVATDNCGEVEEIVLLNETTTPLDCNEGFIKRVDRTYYAVDSSGNESFPCTQEIYLKRLDLDLVEFPDQITAADGTALHCDGNFETLPNGNPSPVSTGFPTLNGEDLPQTQDPYCNVLATFTDSDPIEINCKIKFVRTWTVTEVCGTTHTQRIEHQQIEILDLDGPEISCPSDITVTTSSSQSCTAGVFIPGADLIYECNELDRIDLDYPGGFESDWQGGNIVLPGGENVLTFIAYDNCAPNSSTCTMTVTVNDDTPPVAVCRENTVVSLTIDGTARVNAQNFDNGSFDECELDYFEVSRMNQGCDGEIPEFKPHVDFFCCDLMDNPILIRLRVWDTSSNSNECMVQVEVQDKLPAAINCPPNITVSCQFPFDPDDLSLFGSVVVVNDLGDLQNPNLDPREDIIIDDFGNISESQPKNWGVDGFVYDNCSVSIDHSSSSSINNCGMGTITRTFSAIGPDGSVGNQCQQLITIHNFTPFTEEQIKWPDDQTVNNGCNNLDLDPSQTGEPILDVDICDMAHFNYKDQVFNISNPNDPACFKIIRTWTVVDWCQFEDGQYATWVYDQVIKVINDVAPTITGDCEDKSICSFDPNCGDAFIELVQSAEDDCTPEEDLNWVYNLDLNNNGSFDFNSSNNIYADDLSDPRDASGTYPIGNHRIIWTVEDGCGNQTVCELLFDIVNCTQPKAICHNGIAIELMPMSLNNDGVLDTAMLELPAHLLDAGSHHQCGYDVSFSYSEDINDNVLPLGCKDLGDQSVALYVTDENGNFDVCIAHVQIQDNNDICPPPGGNSGGGSSGLVSGNILMENGHEIKEAEVNLMGSGFAPSMTDELGDYGFPSMPFGGSYEVVPVRDIEYLDGVTTYDIALIQRHILGIQTFDSPYKWIAADVDKNNEVDVRDIAELRSLILGKVDEFSKNDSWRFVDAEYDFVGFNPLEEQFNETYMIPDFSSNMTAVDFVGVKIGDVNSSAEPSNFNGNSETRSNGESFYLTIENMDFQQGEVVEVPVKASDFDQVDAFQFSFMFDQNVLEFQNLKSGAIRMDESTAGFDFLEDGIITFSWNDLLPTTIQDDEVVFTLVFDARGSGNVQEALNASSAVTEAIAYLNGNAKDVDLKFITDHAITTKGYELYQNRPNPFQDHTVIGFRLPEETEAVLTIYDLKGRVVESVKGIYQAGYNEVSIEDLSSYSNQVYYYRLDTEGFSATRKMIVIQ